MKRVVGWRAWFIDGTVQEYGKDEWGSKEDGLLIKMIYYADPDNEVESQRSTRQVQMGMDFYYESVHQVSGEVIRGTGMDLADIKTRYHAPVIVRGQWAPDEYYQKIVAEAMKSRWYGD